MSSPPKRPRGTKSWRRPRTNGTELSASGLVESFLMRQVAITLRGEQKVVSALEAIMLQLLRKSTAGNVRAGRILLGFQAYASRNSRAPLETIFAESDYTASLKSSLRDRHER